jgi:hypothetical protein
MGFVEDFTDDYIKPFGELTVLVIFSIYTRIALCIFLVFSNPLSVEFKYLAVIIFCIPILRYIIHEITGNEMQGGTNMMVIWILPILYAFVTMHILAVYNFSFWLSCGIIILLPTLIHYQFVIASHLPPSNRTLLFTTMCYYIMPFLLVVNYAFDSSKPIVNRYYLIDKSEFTNFTYQAEDGGTGRDADYYLYLADADLDIPPARWVDITKNVHDNSNYFRINTSVTMEKETYKIFDKKKEVDTMSQGATRFKYYFLLQKEMAYKCINVDWKVYNRMKKGHYVFKEIQSGLLGINRTTYR